MAEPLPRVMWLLNHTTARKFEVAMLKKLGFTEIFLPKIFPQEVSFRSASVDFSEDAGLSIPAGDLAILNAADWYRGPNRDTWEIANQYFDLLFFIPWADSILSNVRHFRGAAILRAYGLPGGDTYSKLVHRGTLGIRSVENLGRRFWLGTAYDHMAASESPWMQERELYLPLGLQDCRIEDDWIGTDPAIFFVCPDVASNRYYKEAYREFKRQFAGLRYAIGGAQAVAVNDPHMLGFVSSEQHRRNMREFRVMFYHSTEPNHIHYTPFEAVQTGMPLVFMGGGVLDRLGGEGLPGRCRNYREARVKVQRLLDGDRSFIDKIRNSQGRLLDRLRPELLEPAWRQGIPRVLYELKRARVCRPGPSRRRRIAVMLPVVYRGGTLRSAKLLAQALWIGSRQAGEDADVVFGYPEAGGPAGSGWDAGLPPEISRRNLKWRVLEPDAALRAMRFAGNPTWEPVYDVLYTVPDDGIHQMCDCDLWFVVSDRLSEHLLPIRPRLLVVFDYVQRYRAEPPPGDENLFFAAARSADLVLVTTRFTEQDAMVYAGVPRDRVIRVPMLVPEMPAPEFPLEPCAAAEPYFLWTTNAGRHKNHINAMMALREYYERLDGKVECRISGVDTESFLSSKLPHLQLFADISSESGPLRRRLRILGEMPDLQYRRQLCGARFLWHAARIDNGTLSVVEAALLGVPSLSSKYPAMEEMDTQFGLHLAWMDSQNPSEMAGQLKWMEQHAGSARALLPSPRDLTRHFVDRVAGEYWKVARECL